MTPGATKQHMKKMRRIKESKKWGERRTRRKKTARGKRNTIRNTQNATRMKTVQESSRGMAKPKPMHNEKIL